LERSIGIFVDEDTEYVSRRVGVALLEDSRIYIESMSGIDERVDEWSMLCDGECTLKSWAFEIREELSFFLCLVDSVGVGNLIEWILGIVFAISKRLRDDWGDISLVSDESSASARSSRITVESDTVSSWEGEFFELCGFDSRGLREIGELCYTFSISCRGGMTTHSDESNRCEDREDRDDDDELDEGEAGVRREYFFLKKLHISKERSKHTNTSKESIDHIRPYVEREYKK